MQTKKSAKELNMEMPGKRRRKPERRLVDVVKVDTWTVGVTENDADTRR